MIIVLCQAILVSFALHILECLLQLQYVIKEIIPREDSPTYSNFPLDHRIDRACCYTHTQSLILRFIRFVFKIILAESVRSHFEVGIKG